MSVVADLHFAPTSQARENLLREGVPDETEFLLTDAAPYAGMARAVNPYGDGRAAERIVLSLCNEMKHPMGDSGRIETNHDFGGHLSAWKSSERMPSWD